MTRTLRLRRTAFALCCAILLLGWSPAMAGQQSDPKADPKTQVALAVQTAIRLLEEKKYVEFVKTCLRPNEAQELVAKHGTVEKAAAEIAASDRLPDILQRLRAALKLEPVFTQDGARATFTIDPPIAGEARLVLQKIDGRWVLRD